VRVRTHLRVFRYWSNTLYYGVFNSARVSSIIRLSSFNFNKVWMITPDLFFPDPGN